MDGTARPQQEIIAAEHKQEAPALLTIIAEAVKDPSVNTDKLSSIIDVMERLEKRDAERGMNMALAKLNLPHVKKNGKIPLPSREGPARDVAFAKWEDIDTVIRPLLMAEGLSLSFTAPPRVGDGGGAAMIGRLSHVQGAFREAQIALPLDSGPGRNNLQAMGSTISYGKKYLAFMLLNIVTEGEDDDGQSTDLIDNARAVEIDLRITETGADKAAFLKYMKAPTVPEIMAKDYDKAIKALEAKAKSAGKKKAA